jgi:putative hydrolase of the HAD superfamily
MKAVLFDLDDTLYDHTTASKIALRETAKLDSALASAEFAALERVNSQWLEALHVEVQSGARSMEDARVERWHRILKHFGGDAIHAPKMANFQRTAYLANERLVDGAIEVLDVLKSLGLKLAVVSNSTLVEQVGKLRRLKIAHAFDTVVVSADVGFAKPDARIFRHTIQALGVTEDDCIHIGDNWKADVVGANNAKVKPIWFNRFGLKPGFEGVDEIPNLREITTSAPT